MTTSTDMFRRPSRFAHATPSRACDSPVVGADVSYRFGWRHQSPGHYIARPIRHVALERAHTGADEQPALTIGSEALISQEETEMPAVRNDEDELAEEFTVSSPNPLARSLLTVRAVGASTHVT